MKREKTRYPGVSIHVAKNSERTFYIFYRLDGRQIEEPVGKASQVRSFTELSASGRGDIGGRWRHGQPPRSGNAIAENPAHLPIA
jgi:hypothetical protein